MKGEPENSEASTMVIDDPIKTGLLKNDKTKQGPTILSLLMVPINLPINVLNAINLAIPKIVVLKLLGIQTGGIIVETHGRGISRRPLMLHLLKQTHEMILLDKLQHCAWIIDSRRSYPLNNLHKKFVSTANGVATPVIGEGSLSLVDTLNLDFVLVVPFLLEPKLATSLEPKLATSLEPKLATSLEPKLATSLEPKLATSLEPKLATLLEPKSLTNHGRLKTSFLFIDTPSIHKQ
ncbi:hypothetical protein Lal_00019105 [Lupinus albus]|nr:hypothetical protein Lal_00019105 [Lupinus albus]